MDPITGAALIGGGSALVSGIGNLFGASSTNRMNLKMMREQNRFNKEQQDSQNAWNLRQWERNNAYNTPSMARQRLEAAGFNPFAMAGGGVSAVSGGSTAPPTSGSGAKAGNAIPMQSGIPAAVNAVTNSANDFVANYNNIRMTESQIMKNSADSTKALSDSAKTDADRYLIENYGAQQIKSSLMSQEENRALVKLQQESQEIKNNLSWMYDGKLKVAQIESFAASTAKTIEDRKLSQEQRKRVIQDYIESVARTQGINLKNRQLKQSMPFLLDLLANQLKRADVSFSSELMALDLDRKYRDAERGFSLQHLKTINKKTKNDMRLDNARMRNDNIRLGIEGVKAAASFLPW